MKPLFRRRVPYIQARAAEPNPTRVWKRPFRGLAAQETTRSWRSSELERKVRELDVAGGCLVEDATHAGVPGTRDNLPLDEARVAR